MKLTIVNKGERITIDLTEDADILIENGKVSVDGAIIPLDFPEAPAYYSGPGVGSENMDIFNVPVEFVVVPGVDYTNVQPMVIVSEEPFKVEDGIFYNPTVELGKVIATGSSSFDMPVQKGNLLYNVNIDVQEGNPATIFENGIDTTEQWVEMNGSTYKAYCKQFNGSIPALKIELS